MKNKMIVVMAMAMVAVGMFLAACGGYRVAGVSPGLKVSNVSMVRTSAPVPAPTRPTVASLDQKEVIRQMILQATKDFNEKKVEAFLECYSEDAKIQVIIGRNLEFVSKETYAKMFPKEFDKIGKARYESLSVKMLEGAKTAKAEGVVSISKGLGENLVWTKKYLDLVYQDGKWLIVNSTIEVYFRGDVDPRDRTRPTSMGETPS